MKFPRLRTLLFVPLVLFAFFYISAAILLAVRNEPAAVYTGTPASYQTVAIFGASGTAGDGILKAALANPEIGHVHVITRRVTPRMNEGVQSGKVTVTRHMDYLDYRAVLPQLADVDAVYWAIGISALGVDEENYGRIHVEFPAAFVTQWSAVSTRSQRSFHFISSSDISEDSAAMWVRQKIRAERKLFGLGEEYDFDVIAYRPDYIGPTAEEAHFGQYLLYGFFAPVGAAVKAEQIGKAMFEATARGDEFGNGDKLSTRRIRRLSDAFSQRIHGDAP